VTTAWDVTRDLAIGAHAVSATVAFILGIAIFTAARDGRPVRHTNAYQTCLIVMTVTLAAAIVIDWRSQGAGARIAFPALLVLALYVLWRAARARAHAVSRAPSRADRHAVVDHAGFTLVALFDGFAIVSAIDLGAPAWLVVLVGLVGVVGGHRATRAATSAIEPTARR
jgi:hypothetical protein